MLWIKRNLFMAVGGAIALALLATGIFYAFGAISRNASLNEELAQNESTLTRLYTQDPFPATTNVDAAKRETERLRTAVVRMKKSFAAPPVERVTGLAFRSYRDKLLTELRNMATEAGTSVPSAAYAFSFEEQRTRVDFDPRTFPLIPEQMADVRAICGVLFESRVNPMVNIRRARVSADDERSANQGDYHSLHMMTNGTTGAVINPYEVCFQSLSAELGAVLQKIALSPYGMVIKAIQVESEESIAPDRNKVGPGRPGRPVPPQAVPKGPGADRATTILNERRFQVSMLIYVIRAPAQSK